ncbi:hypothetical protein [Gordonia sp. SND2]|uniref:hypothetical protein n=1 Tax=Gordonia sp. SND2 TaxID=3388659 RepID=UPI00398B7133
MTDQNIDLSTMIEARSDQVNAEDLIAGPVTVTITDVTRGNAEQPINLFTDVFGPRKSFRPGKSMRRILVAIWGPDGAAYVGRRLTIYRDPDVKFGGVAVGGIRISHASHIGEAQTVALTVTRGKRAPFTVRPLPDAPSPSKIPADIEARIDGMDDVEKLGQMVGWLSGLHGEPRERVDGLIARVNDRIADLSAGNEQTGEVTE